MRSKRKIGMMGCGLVMAQLAGAAFIEDTFTNNQAGAQYLTPF